MAQIGRELITKKQLTSLDLNETATLNVFRDAESDETVEQEVDQVTAGAALLE
jgi:hypothetical protein